MSFHQSKRFHRLKRHGKVLLEIKEDKFHRRQPGILVKLTRPLVAYKKVINADNYYSKAVITLVIPKGALVVYHKNHQGKMRASEAKVTGMPRNCKRAYAMHTGGNFNPFWYERGKIVKPRRAFAKNVRRVCCSGIHFFLTRRAAENY